MNTKPSTAASTSTSTHEGVGPRYLSVFAIFVRNSLVRDLGFRGNFIIEAIGATAWTGMNLGFYLLIFQYTTQIGPDSGWGKYEFFVFIATTMFVNSVVQSFFMPNMQQFSELIRTGGLDFALLKPIDTQFIISLQRIEWSTLSNFFVGIGLLVYSLWKLSTRAIDPLAIQPVTYLLFPFYIGCGIVIMYSLMIALAATSIWLGRNQTLYNFWFYITNFSRYPMEIYSGAYGAPLRGFFTFVIPVLLVINVPAAILAKPLGSVGWFLPLFTIAATVVSLLGSRWVFQTALNSYRSASS